MPDFPMSTSRNSSLVITLLDRLAERLPHRTGSPPSVFCREEIVILTRATLVGISASCITVVINNLVQILEDLRSFYKEISTHPIHVVQSELYILELLAECCSAHWTHVCMPKNDGNEIHGSSTQVNLFPLSTHNTTSKSFFNHKKSYQNVINLLEQSPKILDDELVRRLVDAVKIFYRPIAESPTLPAVNILDRILSSPTDLPGSEFRSVIINASNATDASQLLLNCSNAVESYTREILEYASICNWPRVLEYFKLAFQQAAYLTSGNLPLSSISLSEEKSVLVSMRLITSLWVDSHKLSIIIQEICGIFLHLQKSFQITIATVLPLLITRWLENNPEEFVELHERHQRLDGGVETLFDMANTVFDSSRRKNLLYPFLTCILLLQPEIFEVASNMREAKIGSISKKVSFLETLRKSLRNRNETAIYCFTCILRAARHFRANSESALLSYALDVQEEVQEAVFKRYANMDVTLMTATFVTLTHLNFSSCEEILAPLCLAINAPQEYKIVFVSACMHLIKQKNFEDYLPLFVKASEFIRLQLKLCIVKRSDTNFDEQNKPSRPAESIDSIDMIRCIMGFLDISPLILFVGSPPIGPEWFKYFEEIFSLFAPFLISEDENIRYLAHSISLKLMGDGTRSIWKRSKGFANRMLRYNFWKSSSIVLIAVSEQLESQCDKKAGLTFIYDYLETRLTLIKSVTELSRVAEDMPERAVACTKIETALLVSLCSSDLSVCQLVSKCISLFCEEARLTEEASGSSKGLLPTLHNIDIYKEISARDFRFTGLVAFQKRVRGLLKRIQHPTVGILRAWELSFNSWLAISRQIFSQSPESLEEKSLIEWRNYSGLLASLAGACISDRISPFEEPPPVGLQWIDIATSEKGETLLSRYMEQSIHLLSSSNVRIREAARESLSTELAISFYVPLFHKLESVLEVLFDSTRTNTFFTTESRILFAEQAASLLNSIVDRLGGLAEVGGALSINIGLLSLKFARFLDEIPTGVGALRVKIKICQLCITISQKEELLHLRHDARTRNQLLEVIFNWVSRPSSPKDSILTTGNRYDEMICVTRDLGIACLKALVSLTQRLPLQPAEGQTDADASDSKSQMFHTYFNRFLSLLKFDFAEPGKNDGRLTTVVTEELTKTPDLAISALSNLLSANIDVGLKHSLSIGYHEDPVIRMAFIKVLCNILMQGTEFSNLSDASINEKYYELINLITNDMSLTIVLCDSCPSNEVDEMTICFLNIFESRGLGFTLLEALIEHEVAETENEAELLRRNCVATKILSIYGKWKGALYLKLTLQKVLKRLILTSQDLDLELDPARTVSPEELQKNALQLRVVTKVFIDDICNSAVHIPVSFRKICSIISSAVMKRFPEAKFTAVGAFIFLRFFCPAIVAPDAEGLIDSPPSKEMRRGLLLIAKIVQNLANNVLFGAKEPYMFPLNDFLTQNIYRVTTFLREISVPPSTVETEIESESFDFGSSVALHRFLYDNWDHVRQKIGLLERKGAMTSSTESMKVKESMSEALRRLITNLGPPPMDVSWNRPAISLNSPVSYSRFQHFMLQNAGRNTESLVSTRALYDGGESKDGLPMICIILRNFDTETLDFELLLFGFLKTASRMWHRNFGILIDVTRYNGLNEPHDSLFRKLDLLTPTELSKQLTKIYIYNMNSVFRKCFRKMLRFTSKNESSALHPKNVEYHLIGSLQDLQLHFHLSQIHLPKETISVVTDTRYVFQPVMRLSRTRGKIEVVLKVGDRYVQVRTIKKQDIFLGLRLQANINDIFPLSDVDEAPTSIQTEDDSAFGLRTENGKIVMYFTSPRKPDILQAIRGARRKQSKDLNRTISIERLLKPQDVPGTLLNIALMNMAGSDELLRLASYDLLCSLCRAFKFAADSKFLSTKGSLCVPRNPSHFVIDISQQLSQLESQLTADFLNEFFVGWESFPSSQRPLSLAYMAPWIPGLRSGLIPNDPDSDKARDKVASIFRKLIDVALSDHALSTTLEQCVWPAISSDETCVDIFFEEIIKASHGFGFDDERTEILGSILSSINTISIRGKLISRLRKALNRSILRPTRQLSENSAWSEICVLLRLCTSTSFDSGVQSQIYLPELFYLITMLANTGSADARLTVHRLLINTIHSMCCKFPLEESKLVRLRALLISLSETKNSSLFNLSARDGSSVAAVQEFNISILLATENLVKLLAEVSIVAAPSIDMSNAWQSRWMSLVASTAFQTNPSIQPRAFVVIGCLARENVDDDFLYQVLVALRSSISRYVEENECEMLISIVTALTKMMEKLPAESRYGLQLFWLALSLVRLLPLALFNYIAPFLDATLSNLSSTGEFKGGRLVVNLLQGRLPLGDAALQLDDLYGIHFTMENFHFAICASLVKGLTDSVTRPTALRIIRKFLEVTNLSVIDESKAIRDQACMPYLCILLSRAITTEEAKETIWLAGCSKSEELYNHFEISDIINFDLVKDKELLLNASISIVDFDYLEDVVRNRCMIWLNKIAIKRPAVILHLCGRVTDILNNILISCQNVATLESANQLLRTLTSNPKFSSGIDTTEMLQEVLDGIGFGGLWRSSTFHVVNENGHQCTVLTDRLIQLIIA
ncbi:Neurofibromin [Erysiphe neolycopersici]|uniref:Neurofibromin n=1 Tax=Erysiphe neolycopersici TaxID=212602 RepID=A0A420HWR1_9PEZI|nr:Neurofibromin [Erysiphe neolycopersici]